MPTTNFRVEPAAGILFRARPGRCFDSTRNTRRLFPIHIHCGTKAALKPPQSKRYRDDHAFTNFAKRLDCGGFSAAFSCEPEAN
jgi:hypothetical protein